MEDRIIALEEKFSFLEHHVEELDSEEVGQPFADTQPPEVES